MVCKKMYGDGGLNRKVDQVNNFSKRITNFFIKQGVKNK